MITASTPAVIPVTTQPNARIAPITAVSVGDIDRHPLRNVLAVLSIEEVEGAEQISMEVGASVTTEASPAEHLAIRLATVKTDVAQAAEHVSMTINISVIDTSVVLDSVNAFIPLDASALDIGEAADIISFGMQPYVADVVAAGSVVELHIQDYTDCPDYFVHEYAGTTYFC
jgi:hypothetical protein